MNAMLASDLPLPRIGRGKVRDIYAVGDDRVLLLTTDRISAFDVVMAETIPMKGAVLTQLSAWWFGQLEGVVPHHMISADAGEIIEQVLPDPIRDLDIRKLRGFFAALRVKLLENVDPGESPLAVVLTPGPFVSASRPPPSTRST